MANILGVGTGDASDVTQQLGALKTTVGDASSGLVKDVSDNTADIATLQADVMQADNNATNAKQAAENAYPKTGGALDGIINPNQSSGNLDNVIAQIPYNNNIIGVEAKVPLGSLTVLSSSLLTLQQLLGECRNPSGKMTWLI